MELTIEDMAKLYSNMAKVMQSIERIPKTGRVDFISKKGRVNYKYATDSDISDLIRPFMAQSNLAFFCSMTNVVKDDGKTLVTYDMTIACGESGATITSVWYGSQDNMDDKSINKCTTNAIKTFLMKTFIVSSGDPRDDIEPDEQLPEKSNPEKKKTEEAKSSDTPPHWATDKHNMELEVAWVKTYCDINGNGVLRALNLAYPIDTPYTGLSQFKGTQDQLRVASILMAVDGNVAKSGKLISDIANEMTDGMTGIYADLVNANVNRRFEPVNDTQEQQQLAGMATNGNPPNQYEEGGKF